MYYTYMYMHVYVSLVPRLSLLPCDARRSMVKHRIIARKEGEPGDEATYSSAEMMMTVCVFHRVSVLT